MMAERPDPLPGPVHVVAGGGPSLMERAPGRILRGDRIVRVNNFFLEPAFTLGRRVDLAVMGGDPRVAPFMFATLQRTVQKTMHRSGPEQEDAGQGAARQGYDLRAWCSHDPRVARAGRRHLRAPEQPYALRDRHLAREVTALMARYQRQPTTGLRAVLAAHGAGAGSIVLAGIDMYRSDRRYPFQPGRHMRDLMGADLGHRALDTRLHDHDLDRALIDLLLARGDVHLVRAAKGTAFGEQIALGPVRPGVPLEPEPREDAPTDWVPRAGLYPIGLLKALRRGSALKRRVFERRASGRPS